MEKKFQALRIIATLFKILGVIVLIAGIALAALSLVNFAAAHRGMGFAGLRLISGFNFLFGGALGALSFYAFGELISLLLAIEENTRANRLPPAPPGQ